jgi:hypothetical protein
MNTQNERDRGVALYRRVRRCVLRWLENRPKEDQLRTRRRFLLRPSHFGGHGWRWLEWVTVEERFTHGYSCTGYDYTPQGWYFVRLLSSPNAQLSNDPPKSTP